ncbi:MAG: hypothetical protein SPK32_03045 [Bacteroidaceae bacterium]|nr:hypothetical protein [Bacteroidaceae bacterium]
MAAMPHKPHQKSVTECSVNELPIAVHDRTRTPPPSVRDEVSNNSRTTPSGSSRARLRFINKDKKW